MAFSPAGNAARGFVFTGCIAALIEIIVLSANHPVVASMPKTYVMLTGLYAIGAWFAYVVTLWTVSKESINGEKFSALTGLSLCAFLFLRAAPGSVS